MGAAGTAPEAHVNAMSMRTIPLPLRAEWVAVRLPAIRDTPLLRRMLRLLGGCVPLCVDYSTSSVRCVHDGPHLLGRMRRVVIVQHGRPLALRKDHLRLLAGAPRLVPRHQRAGDG